MEELQSLQSVGEIIDALGGTVAVARRYGLRTSQAVWPWRNGNRIPPKYYVTMVEELAAGGFTAPPKFWGMLHADRQSA